MSDEILPPQLDKISSEGSCSLVETCVVEKILSPFCGQNYGKISIHTKRVVKIHQIV